MAFDMKISYLEVYGDSKLVINQLLTYYEVKNKGLVPYFRLTTRLVEEFDGISLEHIPRSENKIADALANLATMLAISEEEKVNVPVCNRWAPTFTKEYTSEINAISVSVMEDKDWR
jgi:ribonuclease HI